VQLEREAADRAAAGAPGDDDQLAVPAEQREHALDGVVDTFPHGRQQHLVDAALGLQHRDQHVLLAGEEVVEAAAVRVGALEEIGHAGRLVALLPEVLHRRMDDALPRGGAGVDLIVHSNQRPPI
jgi:hypothetical protein